MVLPSDLCAWIRGLMYTIRPFTLMTTISGLNVLGVFHKVLQAINCRHDIWKPESGVSKVLAFYPSILYFIGDPVTLGLAASSP